MSRFGQRVSRERADQHIDVAGLGSRTNNVDKPGEKASEAIRKILKGFPRIERPESFQLPLRIGLL